MVHKNRAVVARFFWLQHTLDRVVQAADGKLVVRLLDGDDDVQLTRSLVDHADIDVRVGNHAEDARGGALGVAPLSPMTCVPR